MVVLTTVGAVMLTSPAVDWIAPARLVTPLPAVSVTLPTAASVPFRFWMLAALMVRVSPAATVLGVCCQLRVSTCAPPSAHLIAPGRQPAVVVTEDT